MDDAKNLKVIFTGDTASLEKSFAIVQAQSAETSKSVGSIEKSLSGFGSSAKALGTSLSSYITLPVVGIAVAATKMAVDFQASMELIHTQAGASQDEVNKLSDAVLNLAKQDSYFSAQQLSGGLYHLESLGLRGADAMNALATASNMAAVGHANLEATTSALGAALVTGIKGTQDLSQAAGTLNAIIGQGNMRMDDLVGALGSGILPVAKNAGLSLQDVGAALATLTDNGMGAEESATRLRMTFALMEAPSKKAQNALQGIGISSTQLAMDMRTKGLIPALQDLKKHLDDTYGSTDAGKTNIAKAITEIFGGGRSSAGAQTLINELDRMQTKFDAIGASANSFGSDVAASQDTLAYQFHASWNKINADLIQLGNNFAPEAAKAFKAIGDAISGFVDWLDKLSPGQKQAALDFALVAAAAGPVLFVFGTLAKSISEIIKLTKSISGGISDAFDLFDKWGTKAGSTFKTGFGTAKDSASDFIGKIKDGVEYGAYAVKQYALQAADTAKAWGKAGIDVAQSAVKRSAETVGSWASAAKQMVIDSASFVTSTIGHAAQHAGAWIKAAHESEKGLGGTLITMVIDHLEKAGEMIKHTVLVSAAWVKSAAVSSYAWVTEELPKIVSSFITTKWAAMKESAESGIAWVKNAAISSYAWVTTEMPKIVQSFIVTKWASAKEGAESAIVWVAGAARAALAWVAATAGIIWSFITTTAAAVANGLTQAGVWVGLTAQAGVYGVAIDAVKTQYALFAALAASPIVMGGIVIAAALAALYEVKKAAEAVRDAIRDVDNASNAATSAAASNDDVIRNLQAQTRAPYSPAKQDQARKTLAGLAAGGSFAVGTNYARGGLSLVGEQGPELVNLPRGSAVTPANETAQAMSGGSNVTINVNVGNYGGSDNELRNFARQIWTALQQEAKSHGQTMANNGILTM